jgi:hypothetical protein
MIFDAEDGLQMELPLDEVKEKSRQYFSDDEEENIVVDSYIPFIPYDEGDSR